MATLLTFGLDVFVQDGLGKPLANSDPDQDAEIGGILATTGGGYVVQLVVGVLLTGLITVVMGKAVLGRDVTAAQAWSEARPHWLRLLGLTLTSFLFFAVVGGVIGFLAVLAVVALGPVGLVLALPLGVAGIVVFVYGWVVVALASPALVLERAGVRASIRRARTLLRRAFWRTFGILVLAAFIAGFVAGILSIPSAVITTLHESNSYSTWELVIRNLGSGLALLLVQPFSSGVGALLYLDRRMRAEGLDVTLAAAAARR